MSDLFSKLSTNIDQIKESAEKKAGRKEDLRFLPHFALDKEGKQSIVVRFLPVNDKGDIFFDYGIHSVKAKGVDNISCAYTSSGDTCVVCGKSWDAHEAGDKVTNGIYQRKDKIMAQVVVVSSDIDIPVAEDGNMVKLWHVPFAVRDEVLKSIANGVVSDVLATNFVIKKAINMKNKQTHYKNSFFNANLATDIPPEFIKSYNDGVSKLYEIEKEILPPSTAEDMVEWLAKAEASETPADTIIKKPTSGMDMEALLGTKTKAEKPADEEVVTGTVVQEEPSEISTGTKASSDDLLALLEQRG